MVFTSLEFLTLFLPLVLLIYVISPTQWRNAVLLVGSWVFFGWLSPMFMLLHTVLTVITWVGGLLIDRAPCGSKGRGRCLAAMIVVNVLVLCWYKYANILAATLNEIAHQSGVGMLLDETTIPVQPSVAAACELLGLDPLDLACEGRMIVITPAASAPAALASLQSHPLGVGARQIGHVQADDRCFVQMQTRMGGRRLVHWLAGDALPRIC